MTDLRTAAQQALDYWEQVAWGDAVMADKMDALRAALAQQAEPVASRGWLFRRNADGTIGIFAPPPKPGESQRTSDCVGPNNRDLHELLGKLADHMAAPPQQAEPDAYGYASRVAVSIWQWNYKDTAPNWKPLDDLMGVLTQIDNMTSGLTRRAQQAEPVEPVARLNKKISFDEAMRLKDQMPKGLFRRVDGQAADEIWLCAIEVAERHHGITDPQIEDRLARHGIPMPEGDNDGR